MARLTAGGIQLDAIVSRTLSPEAIGREVARIARAGLAEFEAKNAAALGYTPKHRTFVDGRENAALESVHIPDGTIAFRFEIGLLADCFVSIGRMLREHSPVLTGRYQGSHVFLADGVEADPAKPPEDATEFVWTNTAPYARKIERGQGRALEHVFAVYEGVAALAAGQYGNVAKITFTYRAPLVSYGSKRAKNAARVPAIVITKRG